MMGTDQKIIGSGILLFLTIGTGLWLSKGGKPYSTGAFTLHKLAALFIIIYTVALIKLISKNIDLGGLIVILFIIAGLSVVLLFISGILLSIGNAPYAIVKSVHIIATIIAASSTIVSIILLINK